jgi:hypothetical protein
MCLIWVAVNILVDVVVAFKGVSVFVAFMVPDGTVTVTLGKVLLYLGMLATPQRGRDGKGWNVTLFRLTLIFGNSLCGARGAHR